MSDCDVPKQIVRRNKAKESCDDYNANGGTENQLISDDFGPSIPKSILKSDDLRQIALSLIGTIFRPGKSKPVSLSDIVGQEEAKEKLEELVLLPLKYPGLLKESGLEHGTQAVLLAGPPGWEHPRLISMVPNLLKLPFRYRKDYACNGSRLQDGVQLLQRQFERFEQQVEGRFGKGHLGPICSGEA